MSGRRGPVRPSQPKRLLRRRRLGSTTSSGHGLVRLLAVVLLAYGAPSALAESLDVLSPPGGFSPEEELQIIRDAERIVRSAGLVVEGEPDRIMHPSPRAEFRVTGSLKGEIEPEKVLTVDLAKAPHGLWPRKGERRILCLTESAAGGYELAAHHASILPPTDDARGAIAAWLAGLPWKSAQTEAGPEVRVSGEPEAEVQPLVSPHAESVAEAETILVGVLSNIELAGDGGPLTEEGAEGVFKVDAAAGGTEGAILGYDGYQTPITVRFSPDRDTPRAGRYALFLREDRTGRTRGPGFDSIHEVAISGVEAEAELRKELGREIGRQAGAASSGQLRRPDRAAAGPPGETGRGRLTTIQATLAEWQDAWNKRDLARCIKCYSVTNESRRLYEAGGEARKELAEQIKRFASTVMASPQRIRMIGDAEGGRLPVRVRTQTGVEAASSGQQHGPDRAEATVLIELTVLGIQDRRTTKMRFVREDGEWLILEEGL